MSLECKLVISTEKVCIQVSLGNKTLIEQLPDSLATADKEQLTSYFNSRVPSLVKSLISEKIEKNKKLLKKLRRKPTR